MFRLAQFPLAPLAALSVAVLLTGCGVGIAFPDVQPTSAQVSGGGFQGNDYGGHAPLVGARVFVLQAGTGGYGAKATSLLSAGETTTSFYGNTYTTALDGVTGSPTNGMYYITTDSKGAFNVSGDYTCTAADPVYLYASGGNPNTIPAVTLTSVSAAAGSGTYAGDALVTFQNSGTSLIYQGEMIEFAGLTGAFSGLNYSTTPTAYQVISPATFGSSQALTINQFTVVVVGSSSTSSQSFTGIAPAPTAFQSAANAPSNPAVVNLALLGVCGAATAYNGITAIPNGTGTSTYSGISAADLAKLAVGDNFSGSGVQTGGATITNINTATGTITLNATDTGGNGVTSYNTYTATGSNFSSLSFVYMNEVSTVAATTALAPFASTTANNDAVHIGTSSTNLLGLQNAVLNAANLYDIQGSVSGTGGDGETHIARAVTPTNTGGAVPQTQINTLGNLLANCVDSANTYNAATASGGTQSAQCAALMSNATSDGTTTGTQPNDTATAAINIAHHPSGEPSGNTTFMSGLFNSITGNQPFQPTLSAVPNDFTVGIVYSGNGLSIPGSVAIDASGNAWIVSYGTIVELGPNGTPLSGTTGYATVAGYQNRGIVIDSSSPANTWFLTTTGTNSAYLNKMSSAGVLLSGAGYDTQSTIEPNALAVDSNNNIWVANSNTAASDSYHAYVTELSNSNGSVLATVDANPTQSTTSGPTVLQGPTGIAMDGNGLMWVTGAASENIVSITTGTGAVNWYTNSNTAQPSNDPEFLALDQNNTVWVPSLDANYIQSVIPSADTASGTANAYTVNYVEYTGGGVAFASAIAVDGANNIWVMGANQKDVAEFNNSGTALTGTGGYSNGFSTYGGNRLAIDGSGNVWLPIPNGANVVVLIGAATPVITPMVAAAKTGTPAAKP